MKTIRRDDFISAVLEIEGEKPVYKLGGDGSRGRCDCIGLVIGALRRRGGRWSGIHGSNWAARHEVVGLRPANGSMRRGDIVFKARKPSEAGYALPARYGTSKDQRDYYHAGVVYSTAPLVIIHCTGPGVIRDTRKGAWAWCAELKGVSYEMADVPGTSASEADTLETTAPQATVPETTAPQATIPETSAPKAPPAAVSEPTLRKGMRGDAVRRMQHALLQHGFSLPRYGVDGKFGAETKAAVRAFQTAAGLVVDGVCGPKTWAALKGGVA